MCFPIYAAAERQLESEGEGVSRLPVIQLGTNRNLAHEEKDKKAKINLQAPDCIYPTDYLTYSHTQFTGTLDLMCPKLNSWSSHQDLFLSQSSLSK